jgi:hypothetical protein
VAETKTGPEAGKAEFSGQKLADELKSQKGGRREQAAPTVDDELRGLLDDPPKLESGNEAAAPTAEETAEVEQRIVDQMENAKSEADVRAALLEAGRSGLLQAREVTDRDEFGRERTHTRLAPAEGREDQGEAVLATGKDAIQRVNEHWRTAPDGGESTKSKKTHGAAGAAEAVRDLPDHPASELATKHQQAAAEADDRAEKARENTQRLTDSWAANRRTVVSAEEMTTVEEVPAAPAAAVERATEVKTARQAAPPERTLDLRDPQQQARDARHAARQAHENPPTTAEERATLNQLNTPAPEAQPLTPPRAPKQPEAQPAPQAPEAAVVSVEAETLLNRLQAATTRSEFSTLRRQAIRAGIFEEREVPDGKGGTRRSLVAGQGRETDAQVLRSALHTERDRIDQLAAAARARSKVNAAPHHSPAPGSGPENQPLPNPATPNTQTPPTPSRPAPQPQPTSPNRPPVSPDAWRTDGSPAARTEQRKAENSYEQNIETTRGRERREQAEADRLAREATQQAQEAADRAREPRTRVADADRAQSEALAMDPEARAQYDIRQESEAQIADRVRQFQEQINVAERTNPNLARELRAARNEHVDELREKGDEAVKAETARQAEITKATAKAISEAIIATGNNELSNHSLRFPTEALNDPEARHDYENRALLRRQSLGVEPVPFLERRRGGFLRFRQGDRGPRMLESYYRVPGQDHMVVVERRNRRTGDLINQQILTSRESVRPNGVVDALPPRDITEMVDAERSADMVRLNTSPSRSRWTRLREAVGGPGVGEAFNGPNSVYSRYVDTSGDAATVDRNRDALNRWSRYGKRRGGFLYWMGLRGGRR